MKRVIYIGLTLALAMGLIGCSAGEVSSSDAQKFGQESQADKEAKAKGTYSEERSDR